VPEGKLLVQSVDYFRAFIDDPYLFGAIASNHALGDVFAMGAEAQSVLAIATVPYARERVVEETLYDVLAGCLHMLQGTGAILTGGHSAEGAELSFGLSVNGLVNADSAWSKAGLQVGDALLLTKPIGTGTLFAADMRAQAKGRWIDSALDSMMLSSQQAAQCLLRYQVSACTDLTGFGLLGHLLEMTKASQVNAELYIDQLPVLDGAQETVDAGILSSLQPQNLRLKRVLNNLETAARHARYPLLFDPQTAGGLLVAVPPEQAEACRIDLIACGYADTAIIGTVLASNNEAQPLRIVY
jgi:selenide,water dikinase